MARAAGYSPHRIEQCVRSGRWHALRRGIFCTAQRWALDSADPVLRHVLELVGVRLALGRYTVVSGWSAALHDLPGPAGARPPTLTADCGARVRISWSRWLPYREVKYRIGSACRPPQRRVV